MQQALTSACYIAFWQARYEILASCCAELQRAGLLAAASALPPPFAMLPNQVGPACQAAGNLPTYASCVCLQFDSFA